PVVSTGRVVVDAGQGCGVDVHGCIVKTRDTVDQLVLGLVGDRVGFDDAEGVVDGQRDLGAHPVPDPPQPDAVNAADSANIAYRCLGGVDQVGVHGVHEPAVDVPGRTTQHAKDRHRDEQPDNGVGQREAGHDPDRPKDHGQGGEPVGAGV